LKQIYESLRVVPRHLKAKSPEELSALMLANNLKDGTTYTYHFVQNDGKNWYAWYLKDSLDLIKESIGDA